MHRRFGIVFLVAAACHTNPLDKPPPPPPPPFCGDGIVNAGEQCDGTNLDDAGCVALGYNFGTLACTSKCTFDTSMCVKLCGNGKLDPGEQCDGTLGDLSCGTWGYKICTPTCTIDAGHCVTTPYTQGIPFPTDPGGYTTIAPIPTAPPSSLIMPDPTMFRVTTYQYDLNTGFQQARRMTESGLPLVPLGADVNGDGYVDIATLDTDGTVDRYLYNPPPTNTFSRSNAYSGGSCGAYAWIGAGHATDAGGPTDLFALACPTGATGQILLLPGGSPAPIARLVSDAGVSAAAAIDWNGDGLTDVLAAVDGGILVLQAPSFGVVASLPIPLNPTSLAAGVLTDGGSIDVVASDGTTVGVFSLQDGGYVLQRSYAGAPIGLQVIDLDGDGNPDIVWLDPVGVHVRRNLGSYTFNLFDLPLDAGVPMSLSAGDIDGDGDQDLAATFSTGGTSTLTIVLINGIH